MTIWCANYCLFGWPFIPKLDYVYAKYFDLNHHLLSNYYCNYQNGGDVIYGLSPVEKYANQFFKFRKGEVLLAFFYIV